MSKYYWGVDLGGTKIECAVMQYDNDRCVLRERLPTEGEKGYQHVLAQIKKLIEHCAGKMGEYPSTVGIGTPGTLDPSTGTMKNCNSTHLNGQPLDHDLKSLLGIPVRLANDANCFALAEARLGVVQEVKPDAEVVFGIIMGTGVGSGIVVNGKVLNGCHGIAGEWGHNVLEANGAPCYCGKRGCVETVMSGKGLERFYREQSDSGDACSLSLPEIVALAEQGNTLAQTTMERLYNYFGLAVASIINVLDPDVIVVGGGVGNIDSLYSKGRDAILPHLFNPVLNTVLAKPALGDSAGVFGAAMLVK
ncbi:ROK family protein [Photobacterium lutimaris]|uniref:Sugar kinase n=1 Tax=Photobacterium lutimaris TaxID=388278 RepID=A0A2T3J532_9GAMM|nr:ROK family protein [Photobacterium lutimaris]PSU36399.1 sugar kinase [Photobacterium lutimaris]TDR74701.1 N-acetylglucosamine kinase [Photobacterium lutimaris]